MFKSCVKPIRFYLRCKNFEGERLNTTAKAHIAVLCTNIFFAVNYSLVKLISPSLVGPFALNLLRAGLSALLFWIIWAIGKQKAGIRKKDLGRFLFCGLTGVAINQMLFVKGLTMTSTIHASLLMLVTPLVVTVFALWILKEAFTLLKAVGLLLGVCGSVLLVLQKEQGHQAPHYLLGDLLILLNSISYAIYFILVKPLMKTYDPLHVIRWVFTIGFFMILPFAWKETGGIQWAAFRMEHVVALACVVVTGTFVAYYFIVYAIQHLGAGTTGTYIYTQPVFVVTFATIFLNESFGWPKILAALLIAGGVYLVSFRKRHV